MKDEGGAALGLAEKPDDRSSKRSSERDGPASERPLAFRPPGTPLAEPLIRSGAEGAVLSALPNLPVNDLRSANEGQNAECPDSERLEGMCHPPDEAYIQDCYRRILDLRSCESKGAIVEGMNDILAEMAEKAQREERSYTVMVNGALMLHWTRKEGDSTAYDEHMQTHVDAISVLARAWMKDKTFSGKRGKKIRILEASCGTGAVLEAFLDAMPANLLRKIRVTANDISSASLETTKKRLAKFEGRVKIEYTQMDLTQEVPAGRRELIILSQTLPFLNDEKALMAERLQLALPSDTRHVTTKRRVLETLINRLNPGKGELMLIDEYPMRLSKIPDDFDAMVEDALFREIFRPISRGMLINDVMKRIERARFQGHVETFIDRVHSMYLIASSSLAQPESIGAGIAGQGKQQEAVEDEDMKRIERRAKAIHREIIGRLQSFEEADGTEYRPINEGQKRLEIDLGYYMDKIEHKPGYWRTNGNYNLVVLKGLTHHIGQEGYRCLIEKLKRSHKVGPGSAILFIDEWPAPAGSPNPVGNGDARSLIFNAFDDQVFCSSIRSGNKYGYLYVVRNL